jgi:hypothetical protein
MSATTAGFRITVRGRRIYLVDAEPTSGDPGVSAHEARELAARLLACVAVVERRQRDYRDGRSTPDDQSHC